MLKKGDIIGIVEAMKLFNEIEAEEGGKVLEILVDNASPVEFDPAANSHRGGLKYVARYDSRNSS